MHEVPIFSWLIAVMFLLFAVAFWVLTREDPTVLHYLILIMTLFQLFSLLFGLYKKGRK
tara:strand:+ start:143 stop:319 length:177 start_codon:yes stop_codon:yes gene_type:complete